MPLNQNVMTAKGLSVDAKTARCWSIGKPTKHIGNAMVADIDPTNPGLELWATDDPKG